MLFHASVNVDELVKIRHSGLDPEYRKYLIILDSRFRGNDCSGMDSGACPGHRSGIRRNDKIAGFMQLGKGLLLSSPRKPGSR